MSEMIERVARALCIADGCDPDQTLDYEGIEFVWMSYERGARAAITAMRDMIDEALI